MEPYRLRPIWGSVSGELALRFWDGDLCADWFYVDLTQAGVIGKAEPQNLNWKKMSL